MTNEIAQITSLPVPGSAGSVGWLMLCLAALAVAAKQIIGIFDHFREQPVPLATYLTKEAAMAAAEATHQRFVRIECEVNAMRSEIKDLGNRLDAKDEARSIALHNRINDLEALVNRVMGKLEGTKR